MGSREHGRRILLRAREVGDHPVPMSAAVAAQLDELSVHAERLEGASGLQSVNPP